MKKILFVICLSVVLMHSIVYAGDRAFDELIDSYDFTYKDLYNEKSIIHKVYASSDEHFTYIDIKFSIPKNDCTLNENALSCQEMIKKPYMYLEDDFFEHVSYDFNIDKDIIKDSNRYMIGGEDNYIIASESQYFDDNYYDIYFKDYIDNYNIKSIGHIISVINKEYNKINIDGNSYYISDIIEDNGLYIPCDKILKVLKNANINTDKDIDTTIINNIEYVNFEKLINSLWENVNMFYDNREQMTTAIVIDNGIIFDIGSEIIYKDGSKLLIDDAPYIQNDTGYAMIPLRSVEKINNRVVINWDNNEKIASISIDDTELCFNINKGEVTQNNNVLLRTTSAEIRNDRIFIPLREFCNVFNYNLDWIADSKTIILR